LQSLYIKIRNEEMEHRFVTSKREEVIPAKLKKKYKIKTGTTAYFREKGDRIEIKPVTSKTIQKNIGILGTKGKLLKILMEEKKKEREL